LDLFETEEGHLPHLHRVIKTGCFNRTAAIHLQRFPRRDKIIV
jgi:hypothetical protein